MTTATADIPPAWDRAVAYGDGLFETILVLDGCVPLWKFHRRRLEQSLQRMQINADIAAIEQRLMALAKQNPDAVIKLVVARSGGGGRGYDARQGSEAAVQLRSYPLPHYPSSRIGQGIRLHLCRQRLSHSPALAGIKHLNRLEQVLAASEWDRHAAEEGLVLDESGAVIEGTVSNIFLLRDRKLFTPRLDRCGVAGVMRAVILQDIAPGLGLPTVEKRLALAELLAADTVFVCNSIFGIWPVRSIGVSQLAMRPDFIAQCWEMLTAMGYARLYGH